ncbi:MAG: phosphoenolpyruvate carboxykinase (GTP), partial [Clostridia bacterium]|nr:phosphoenolpyruvate carboxykinase (GTP) [Clostridia bacterium]
FAGYHMGDYFQHWIDMGKKVKNPPKIFNVNWFRQDENGNFMWPGFGDNMRVLEWILKRCDENPIDADETAIGYVPKAEDIDISELDYEISEGKKFDIKALKDILTVDKEKWSKEAEEIENYYNTAIRSRIPAELWENLDSLKKNCHVEKPAAKPAAKKATAAKTTAKKPAAKKPSAKKTSK